MFFPLSLPSFSPHVPLTFLSPFPHSLSRSLHFPSYHSPYSASHISLILTHVLFIIISLSLTSPSFSPPFPLTIPLTFLLLSLTSLSLFPPFPLSFPSYSSHTPFISHSFPSLNPFHIPLIFPFTFPALSPHCPSFPLHSPHFPSHPFDFTSIFPSLSPDFSLTFSSLYSLVPLTFLSFPSFSPHFPLSFPSHHLYPLQKRENWEGGTSTTR